MCNQLICSYERIIMQRLMNMLLLRFAGLFFLCFQLTSCMESHVLGMESFLPFPSSSVMGQLNRNFLKGFHKHFCIPNYAGYFTITTKSERMKDVERIGSGSSTREWWAPLCVSIVTRRGRALPFIPFTETLLLKWA